jgi:NAD(P)-dependent dehydrogenase (short-subunit alcohol dehydrogenase family)
MDTNAALVERRRWRRPARCERGRHRCLRRGYQGTARLIEHAGGRALAVRCDVTRAEEVKAALDKTMEVVGRLHSTEGRQNSCGGYE